MEKKIITQSSIRSFLKCKRHYKYAHIDNIEKTERPIYFDIGSAFHEVLEYHYSETRSDYPSDSYEMLIEKYFADKWPANPTEEESIAWNAASILVKKMYEGYREQYQQEPFLVIKTEEKFTVPVVNPSTGRASKKYAFSGIVDGIVKEDEKYWLIEHKTAKSISRNYINSLVLDTQCIAYIDAIQRYFGIKIEGVIYNIALKSFPVPPKILKKGGLSVDKNQNTSLELYLKEIELNGLNISDYQEHLDWLKENQKKYFFREYLVFPEETIEEWRQELWQIQKDISEAEIHDRWYKNTSQCTMMGTCQFHDICTAIHKDFIKESLYTVRKTGNPELEEPEEDPVF